MAVDLDVWSNGSNRETDMDASARERSNKSIYNQQLRSTYSYSVKLD